MSVVWGATGLSFEYPTCYRVENRVLTLRAGVLLLGALALFWLTAADPPQSVAATLTRVERGSAWPHVTMAVFLMGLAVIDLIRVARQQRVRLSEGKPGPLAAELPLQSSGVSSGGEWLKEAIESGAFAEPMMRGHYGWALRAVSPRVGCAPVDLQAYLRVRIAQAIFVAGLVAVLGIGWAVFPASPALPVLALLMATLLGAHVIYCAWIADDAPGWKAELGVLAFTAVAAAGLVWLGPRLPQAPTLQLAELPGAVMLLLASVGLLEVLALFAARAQIDALPSVGREGNQASAEFDAGAARVVEEVDNELMRRWTEGVPNRRFIRRWAGVEVEPAQNGLALEETQPALPAKDRERLPAQPLRRSAVLLALVMAGLLVTLVGVAVWMRLATALLESAAAPWGPASIAVVMVLVGGYAVRVGHFLWSRVEVESTLYLVELGAVLKGKPSAAPGRGTRLRVRVEQITSVFFLAATPRLGSRRPLRVAGDQPSAEKFLRQVDYFVGRSGTAPEPRGKRPQPEASSAPKPSVQWAARFCVACGTPRPEMARFCLSCGAPL